MAGAHRAPTRWGAARRGAALRTVAVAATVGAATIAATGVANAEPVADSACAGRTDLVASGSTGGDLAALIPGRLSDTALSSASPDLAASEMP